MARRVRGSYSGYQNKELCRVQIYGSQYAVDMKQLDRGDLTVLGSFD